MIIAIVLCVQLILSSSARSASEDSTQVKELNFVFLHGMGASPCSPQLLSDHIVKRLPAYIFLYQQSNPDITIRVNTLMRCYPGHVDIQSWANNIADSIHEHFRDKDNLILVGHSMGGKTALYAVAENVGNLAEKVALVVTINSPIKSLDGYYVPGGGPVAEYCRTALLGSDEGVCSSIVYYDSCDNGVNVSNTKHWLAFVSSETAPLSQQFDHSGIDPWPRNMDDGVIPLSAQFSDGADVIYYGAHGHSDFAVLDKTAQLSADQLLRYIFGGPVECCVIESSGTMEHKADWILGTDYWNDIVGGVVASTGRLQHKNDSFFRWQEWEDVVGSCSVGDKRSYSHARLLSIPLLTGIEQAHWFISDNVNDCRLYLRSRAAPRTSVKIDWTVYRSGLLPLGIERAFYDVEISDGTPLAAIRYVSWMDDDPRDTRLWIWSEAQSPFRWFKAEWRTYKKENRQRKIIDEID